MKKNILNLFVDFRPFWMMTFWFSILFSIYSCDFSSYFSYEKVTFYFDEKSVTNENEIEKIMFINENNEVKEIIFDNSKQLKIDNKDSFSLLLSQNLLTPILVYYKDQLYPMGTIYPYSTKITFHDGFSSKILFRFLNETQSTNQKLLKKFIEKFNWQRFSEKIKTFENPWILNQELILEGLNLKKITSNHFKILE